jgi:hypothetical protein
MPRQNENPRRSGRFKNTTATAAQVIGPALVDRIYRFHNTAKKGGAAGTLAIAGSASTNVPAGGSVDIFVPINGTISVVGQGVYDHFSVGDEMRSGAFKAASTIAKLSSQSAVYRVINSSDSNDLTVKVSTLPDYTIKPESSADILFTGDVLVSGTNPEGVFDRIN